MSPQKPDTPLVQRRFTRAAPTYEGQAALQACAAEHLARIFHRHSGSQPPHRILEIGAGSGLLTRAILGQGIPPQDYTANDLTPAFAARYAAWGCRTLIGDATAIDLPHEQQAIVSSNCFQWIAPLDPFFKTLRSTLVPGGHLLFSTFGPENFSQIRHLTGIGLDYPDCGMLKNMLHRAGFDVLLCENKEETLYFDDAKHLLRHFSATGVNGIRRQTWTPRRLQEFENRYRRDYPGPDGRLPLSVDYIWIASRATD